MNKNSISKLISLAMSVGVYDEYFSECIMDDEVNNCLTKFYFSCLCDKKDEKDNYYNEFEKLFIELNEEKQEIVKKEIAKILDIEYKPKVKKKER